MNLIETLTVDDTKSWSTQSMRWCLRLGLKPLFAKMPSIKLQRALLNIPKLMSVTAKGVEINSVQWGNLVAERLTPSELSPDAVILYFHGGGFCVGNASLSRPITSTLAKLTRYNTYSVDYSLAPESPFPAALNEALLAYVGLQTLHPGTPVVLAGDSAGANICLSLTRLLQSQCFDLPIALYLISPWTDLSLTLAAESGLDAIDPILSMEALERWAKNYTPSNRLSNLLCSPIEETFEGYPPNLIQVGTDEILFEDSMRLQKAMVESRVISKLQIWSGMWHVFQLHAGLLSASDEAIQSAAGFLISQVEKSKVESAEAQQESTPSIEQTTGRHTNDYSHAQ